MFILRQADVYEITIFSGVTSISDILLVGPVETIAPHLLEAVHLAGVICWSAVKRDPPASPHS